MLIAHTTDSFTQIRFLFSLTFRAPFSDSLTMLGVNPIFVPSPIQERSLINISTINEINETWELGSNLELVFLMHNPYAPSNLDSVGEEGAHAEFLRTRRLK